MAKSECAKKISFYAGFSKDMENLESSSSGGIFYELCKHIINENGVVYGAAQKSVTEVVHMRATSLEDIKKLRRSKYLKSMLHNCFIQVKEDLEAGVKVLFSGVPCQIAALYRYLEKEYANLYTVEVVCHGMPLTSVFKQYVEAQGKGEHGKLVDICFRDKSNGWKDNSIREYYEDGYEYVISSSKHPVHSLYIKGINMEEKCAKCEYARLPRVADITLADFWKYEGELREINKDRGLSLIGVSNDRGNDLIKAICENIYLEEVSQESALDSCRHMGQAPYLGKSHRAFVHLGELYSATFALNLLNQFGDVVLADELCAITKKDASYVRRILQEDTQEIIYLNDDTGVLQGIVTFGAFVQAYAEDKDWVNYNFGKVVFSDNCIEDIEEVFARSAKILRVPVVDETGKLLFEVRRTFGGNGRNDIRKGLLSFIEMKKRNLPCYFIQRPDYIEDYAFNQVQKRHIENKYSFPKLIEDISANEAVFKEILGDKYSAEYVEALGKISPIIPKGKRYVHADATSKLINVIGGLRITTGQPERYERTIHVYGRCGVFGYAVEDADTMPSQLQGLLKNAKVRVINHGLWGGDDAKILNNLYHDIWDDVIKEDDIVLIYMRYLPYMDMLKPLNVNCYDTTQEYYRYVEDGGMFYDIPGHMTAEGYEFIAKCIAKQLQKEVSNKKERTVLYKSSEVKTTQEEFEKSEELKEYLDEIKKLLPTIDFTSQKVGAIVMNCNPFTKGHEYLIETARKEVDTLLIFVLEEDKSYFSFKDRIAMVKLGTEKMDNVYVLPSGKFMISALTFPEYFLKDQQQEVVINPALDVEIFGKYIAPEFNISVRFVGTEPVDKVTNQYNQTLKRILPEYGIVLREIERLMDKNVYISATEIRRLIKCGNYEEIKKIAPESTHEYICKNMQ